MTVAAGVTVGLPRGWIELDLAEADPLAEYRRAVGTEPDRRLMAAAVEPAVAELRRLAAQADVLAAAFVAEIVTVPGADRPGVLAACLTLAVSPPVGGLAEVRRDLAALDGGTDIRTVALPAGAAVLVTGVVPTALPVRMWRYFVPIPGLERMAVLSFVTPNIDADYGAVFAAVAGSLEFQAGD